jgi:hypothetical protein
MCGEAGESEYAIKKKMVGQKKEEGSAKSHQTQRT